MKYIIYLGFVCSIDYFLFSSSKVKYYFTTGCPSKQWQLVNSFEFFFHVLYQILKIFCRLYHKCYKIFIIIRFGNKQLEKSWKKTF